MPKITEKWIMERVRGYVYDATKQLAIKDIEKRFIEPFLDKGAKLLTAKHLTDDEKRSMYAQQIRCLKLETDESDFLEEPCKALIAVMECREDNRVI